MLVGEFWRSSVLRTNIDLLRERSVYFAEDLFNAGNLILFDAEDSLQLFGLTVGELVEVFVKRFVKVCLLRCRTMRMGKLGLFMFGSLEKGWRFGAIEDSCLEERKDLFLAGLALVVDYAV